MPGSKLSTAERRAALVATGLIYTLMAIAAILLHGDPLAANPLTVVRGVIKGGLPYLFTCAVAIAAAVIATFAVREWYKFEDAGSAIFGCWGTCLVIVYLSIVVARMLGMCCFVRSNQIAWFPDRPRCRSDHTVGLKLAVCGGAGY